MMTRFAQKADWRVPVEVAAMVRPPEPPVFGGFQTGFSEQADGDQWDNLNRTRQS